MDHGRSSAGDEFLKRLDALEHRIQELATLVAQKDVLIAEKDALIAVQQDQLAAQQVSLDQAHEQLTLLKKALFAPRRARARPATTFRVAAAGNEGHGKRVGGTVRTATAETPPQATAQVRVS